MWAKSLLIVQAALFVLAAILTLISNLLNAATLPLFLAVVGCLLLITIAGVVALVLLVLSVLKPSKTWSKAATAAVVLGVLPLAAIFFMVGREGFAKPLIHDISTDVVNPPEFVEALKNRKPSANSLNYEGAAVADQQHQFYPQIKSIELNTSAESAFASSLQIAKNMGWTVVANNSKTLTIEAFDKSVLFGFVDDIIVRVLATEQGARVDVRSVSRVGRGDFGANAERIKQFEYQLRQLANEK